MFTNTDLRNLQDDFTFGFEPVFDSTAVNVSKGFADKNVNEISSAVKYIFSKAILEIPQGITTPNLRQDYSILDDGSLRGNLRIAIAGTSFVQTAIITDSATNKTVAEFVSSVMQNLIRWWVERQNIAEINLTLDKLTEEAGNPFSVRLVKSDKALHSISDSEVVLGVNDNLLYDYKNLLLFADKVFPEDGSNLSAGELAAIENKNALIDSAFNSAVEDWVASSSVDFIKEGRGKVLKVISNLGNKKLRTLLREVSGQTMSWLDRSKKDMVVKYDQDDVFALIERKDGKKELLLSPVNINSGESVDIEIL